MQFSLKALPTGAELKRLFVFEKPSTEAGSAVPELAVVELLVSGRTMVDDLPVPAGTIGTVVMVHGDGEAFDVEIDNPAGLLTVLPGDFRVIHADAG